MNAGLAIFTTPLGAPFIERDMEDLLPSGTVAVDRYSSFALDRLAFLAALGPGLW